MGTKSFLPIFSMVLIIVLLSGFVPCILAEKTTSRDSQCYMLDHLSVFTSMEIAVDESALLTSTMWNRTYGGTPFEVAESVVESSDGGFVIAGWRWDKEGMMLIKTDKLGNTKWTRTYGKIDLVAHDGANSVIETSDGGFVLAGYQRLGQVGYNDVFLVKTNSRGIMMWSKTYGGAAGDSASTVIETSDKGYAIAGLTESFGAGNRDVWLIKTDLLGKMKWNKTYGGTGRDEASALVETSDGGFALAGLTESFGAGEVDFWLIKTDVYGNVQWNWTYGGTGSEHASALVETGDGGFAIAGDTMLIKTDANGVMEWNQTYQFTVTYNIPKTSLTTTSDGGYALARGESLVKIDANGNLEWKQTFEPGTERRSINSLIETSDDGYVLAGFYGDFDKSGEADFWVIKTDKHGYIPEFQTLGLFLALFLLSLIAVTYKTKLTKSSKIQ